MEWRTFQAPGRVNLIGEHTDYNDGFVMPAALDLATRVSVAPRQDRRLVVRSLDFDEEASFDLSDSVRSGSHWCDYVRGVAWACDTSGLKLPGADLRIQGGVPIGSGLSSSAALEVATALALLSTIEAQLPGPELARLCQRAENDFVGMRCGIMDQFIACCAHAGQALLLDCRSLEYRLLPLDPRVRLVICNTGVKHELAGGEYNRRRQACEEGAALLGVAALRDARPEQVDQLPELLRRRCRHVVSENLRVGRAAAALEQGDLEQFGQLMGESHRSLRDDYEVSCPELDLLVERATPLEGVYGARMTGGGFGGCTINLVRADCVDSFRQRMGGEIYVCQAAGGASEVR